MKMTIIPSDGNQNTAAVLSHGDQSTEEWHIQRIKKIIARPEAAHPNAPPTVGEELVSHINRYWEYLDEDIQARIFNCYREIFEVMERVYDPTYMIKEMMPYCTELLNLHDLEAVQQWMAFHGKIQMPPNIEAEFVTHEPKPVVFEGALDEPEYIRQMGAAASNTEDLAANLKPKFAAKTYVIPEYRQLLAMVLVLRVMIPIWGEFLRREQQELGPWHVLTWAYSLISESNLAKSPAAKKLREYVENNIRADQQITFAAQIIGLGKELNPEWLFASVLINRVCIGDISWKQDGSHLVANIYHFVNQQYRQPDGSSFGMSVREKRFDGPDRNQEHSASRLESYRLMEDIPIGVIAVAEKYLSDYKAVAQHLYPAVDLNLVDAFMQTSQGLLSHPVANTPMLLLQWVLSPVISPRALRRTVKRIPILLLPVAQAVLWQEGHKDLAVLLSALPAQGDFENASHFHMDSISQDKLDAIEYNYPYDRIILNSKNKGKQINTVLQTINNTARDIDAHPWKLHVPEFALKETLAGRVKRGIYFCPSSIRVLLADLVLWHVKRPKLELPSVVNFSDEELRQALAF